MSETTTIRMSETFMRFDEELEEITGEKTRTGRLEMALKHFYEYHENLERMKRNGKLTPELAEALSTNQYPIDVEPASYELAFDD